MGAAVRTGVIRTEIPSRLDRLPWSRFHWRIVVGLGTAWVLDGLEVTIVASVASRMTEHGSGIHITAAGIGIAAALYVAGACSGALFFGELTDRFGRKKLFMITLAIYMVSTAITAVSFTPIFFFIFRFLTGTGIGGEYAAINSAIDELIPARARGGIDLVINGSYWLGSILGSALAIAFLNESWFPKDVGWRLTFAIGIVLGTIVLLVRRHVPESPRWLFIHGMEERAEAIVRQVEAEVEEETGVELEPVTKTLTVRQRRTIGFWTIAKTAVKVYPRRSILCIALFVGQAFIYNGITFNLGTLMSTFFHVAAGLTPLFLIIFAASNFLGPLLLGRLFDTVGRIPMISGTYLGSAALGLLLAGLFVQPGLLGRWTFIIVLIATFFLASAGASAAYLTSSEIFPMETRALAIAFFYAIGTAVGGIIGPLLFGPMIASKARDLVGVAFLIGSVLMAAGGVTEVFFGVKAEQAQLEDIAKPLTAEEAARSEDGSQARAPSGRGREPEQAGETTEERERHAGEVRRARREAAEERARAADHRAAAHERRAASAAGDPGAEREAEVEDTLAEISEATALAADERVAAAEEGEGPRAEAARQRARSHEEEAAALGADDEEEAARHGALAEAALERARAGEQLALAAEARERLGGDDHSRTAESGDHGRAAEAAEDGGGSGAGELSDSVATLARAEMHEGWARMHAHLAHLHEQRAAGGGDGDRAAEVERQAQVEAERARAAAYRAEAAEHRGRAEREARQEEEGRRRAEEAAAEAARHAQRDAEEARVRGRLERRRARERTGLRRYLPGPGRLVQPPAITALPPFPEEALDHEIVAIERALHEHGPTERRELARLVGARYWGPGVFAEALRQAVGEDGVRRLSRGIYGPVDRPVDSVNPPGDSAG